MARRTREQRRTDLVVKGMNLTHRVVLKLSGGRLGNRVMSMQAVELHTTGRKSGQRRSVMLTAPLFSPERVVVIASKGGDDRNPDWYANLVANPDVSLTINGTEAPYTARTASAQEKAELWPQIVKAYRGYDGYQKRTTRDIPVVICTPR